MTAHEVDGGPVVVCPSCDGGESVALSDGTRLCLSCRAEWNPANPPAREVVGATGATAVPISGGIGTAAHITHVDVLVQDLATLHTEYDRQTVMTAEPHTEAEAEDRAVHWAQAALDAERGLGAWRVLSAAAQWSSAPFAVDPAEPPSELLRAAETAADDDPGTGDPLAELIGHEVVYDGNRVGIVRGFADDDHVTIETRRGRKVVVEIERVTEDRTAARQAGPAAVDLDDDEARQLAATYALGAALALEAGTAMVDGTGPTATVGVAPSGWLPFDTDEAALVEQMAACAVAALVRAFDLPREQVAMVSTALRAQAQPGDTERMET